MKKVLVRFLSVLLAVMLTVGGLTLSRVSLPSFEAEAASDAGTPAVAAGQTVRYVKTGGAGKKDGSSPDNAATSLTSSVSAVGQTGGVVVICGNFTCTQTFTLSPAHPVTLTSFYDGVDYRPGATFTCGYSFSATNDLTLEYMNFTATANIMYYARWHNFTVGQGMNVTVSEGKRYPMIFGGWNVSSANTVEKCSNTADTVIRIDSGTWDSVIGGNYRSANSTAIGVNSGDVALIINGGHFTRTSDVNFPVSATGMNYQSGNVILEINGGTFDNCVYAVMRLGGFPSDATLKADRAPTGDVLCRITGGTFNHIVGVARGYDASYGDNAYNLNHGVEGNTTFVVTGGTFSQSLIARCVYGDLLLKYDPTKLQSNFLSLCDEFPIRQIVDGNAAPDTANAYVSATLTTSVDHNAGGADPYVVKDPNDDCYYYVYSASGVKITKCGNMGLFRQGTVGTSETTGLPSYTKIYNAVRPVVATNYSSIEGAPLYQFWAPEMHYFSREIAGEDYGWYIYVAASTTDSDSGHRMYVYRSPERDNPMCTNWEYMGKLNDPSGCWAIDGTVIQWQNQMYFAWSGRETADTSGKSQNIYIAAMTNPYTLSGSRVLLSTPDQSWERKQTSPAVNEGPQAFVYNNKLYLSYSADGSWGKDYCVGLLTYKGSGSLTVASNWTKRTSGPFFTGTGSAAPYGTGHASITTSLDGTPWIVFHGNGSLSVPSGATWWACRRIYAQPLSLNASMTTNYAKSPSYLNTIAAHNGEYCREHFLSGRTEIRQATCVAAGGTSDTCLRCKAVVTLSTTPATGNHTYGGWTVTREATGLTEGTEQRVCAVCGNTQERPIPVKKVKLDLSDATGLSGGLVTVNVTLTENPGLCAARFFLSYNAQALTPVRVVYTDRMPGSVAPNLQKAPLVLLWNDGLHDSTATGVAATVTFRVAEGFTGETVLTILSETADDCLDTRGNGYFSECDGASVTVTAPTVGDIDRDGALTNADMTLMLRALAGWQMATDAYDLDGNGRVNNRDAIFLIRKMSGWLTD